MMMTAPQMPMSVPVDTTGDGIFDSNQVPVDTTGDGIYDSVMTVPNTGMAF